MFKNIFTEKMENVKDAIEFKKQNCEITLAARRAVIEFLPEIYASTEAADGVKLNKFQKACGRMGAEMAFAVMLVKDVVA